MMKNIRSGSYHLLTSVMFSFLARDSDDSTIYLVEREEWREERRKRRKGRGERGEREKGERRGEEREEEIRGEREERKKIILKIVIYS